MGCVTRKTKRAKIKMNQVHPHPSYSAPFTVDEVIQCQGCMVDFPLVSPSGEPGIQINCAGCDQFYHCQIAGTCKGPQCNRYTSIGVQHQLSWCVHCVPKYEINQVKKTRDEPCVCHECWPHL